jgi:SAM-dependent methyltransferase
MLQELVNSLSSRIVNRARRVLPRPFAKPECFDEDEQTANELAILSLSTSGWYNMRRRELAPGFRVTHTDAVVDVGCGLGHASVFAAKQGAAVVSLDVDAASIERLEQQMSQLPARSFQAFVSHCNPIPLAAECATVVLAMEVLEHVDDPPAFLRELVRIGKPGARYLISVPDPTSEAVQGEIAPPNYWRKPNHIRIFQRSEFRGAVEAAGLAVEQQFYYGFYSSMWWSLRWAVREDGIPFGHSGHSPLLRDWNKTWKNLLSSPHGQHIWKALEKALPKSQAIIARKPSPHAAQEGQEASLRLPRRWAIDACRHDGQGIRGQS